jgi:N-methylhydantoinase B
MLCNGGAASAFSDGWTNFVVPVVAGQLMRDSVEVDELKYPVIFKRVKQICDSGGAGKYRGALAAEITYGPRLSGMEVIYPLDGAINPPKGVQGGLSGHAPYSLKLDANGEETLLPHNNHQALEVGEFIVGRGCGGGGYGDPFERDVDLVLHDVNEGWVSAKMAEELYGVVTRIHPETRVFLCDEQATAHNRASAVAPRKSD